MRWHFFTVPKRFWWPCRARFLILIFLPMLHLSHFWLDCLLMISDPNTSSHVAQNRQLLRGLDVGGRLLFFTLVLLRTAFRQSCADLFKSFPMLHNVQAFYCLDFKLWLRLCVTFGLFSSLGYSMHGRELSSSNPKLLLSLSCYNSQRWSLSNVGLGRLCTWDIFKCLYLSLFLKMFSCTYCLRCQTGSALCGCTLYVSICHIVTYTYKTLFRSTSNLTYKVFLCY